MLKYFLIMLCLVSCKNSPQIKNTLRENASNFESKYNITRIGCEEYPFVLVCDGMTKNKFPISYRCETDRCSVSEPYLN